MAWSQAKLPTSGQAVLERQTRFYYVRGSHFKTRGYRHSRLSSTGGITTNPLFVTSVKSNVLSELIFYLLAKLYWADPKPSFRLLQLPAKPSSKSSPAITSHWSIRLPVSKGRSGPVRVPWGQLPAGGRLLKKVAIINTSTFTDCFFHHPRNGKNLCRLRGTGTVGLG